MKIINLALLAVASAIRIKDIGDLDLPPLKDEADGIADKQVLAQSQAFTSLAAQDKELLSTFTLQLDQALRNSEQGEMGRALAVSKLSQIKLSIENFEGNVKKETEAVISGLNATKGKHMPSEISDEPIK